MTPYLDAHRYVQCVIDIYLRLPDTPNRARTQDRQLAAHLHRTDTPLALVETALLLATARRHLRPSDALPLCPIRSLRYFLPVIEELTQHPPSPSYLRYLRLRAKEILGNLALDDGSKKDTFT